MLGQADATERTLATVARLEEFLRQSPLDILADAILPHLALRGFESAARDLFESYDAFIGLLNNSTERGALDALKQEDAADDPRFERARQLGKRFQRGLDTVFLEPNETPLYSLTRTYGVF